MNHIMERTPGVWKKVLAVVVLTIMVGVTYCQEGGDKVSMEVYGFVRTYFNFDSRKSYTVLGGEYNMQPYDRLWNEDSTADINAQPHAQLQAFTSRVGLKLTGPQLGNWESGGCVETDFGGFGSNNGILRLRLAYVKLSKKGEGSVQNVVIGQDWHPLSGEVMPEVIGMASGAPFRPHSRAPQVRWQMERGKIGLSLVALSQLQFMNNGPRSASDSSSVPSLDYAYNAVWPELFGGISFSDGHFFCQAGLDFQTIRPRTHATVNGIRKPVSELVKSFSPSICFQYDAGFWRLRGRTMLASNTSHLSQLVGYAVTSVGSEGEWTCEPMHAAISYINLSVGKALRGNFFWGYMKNLGCRYSLNDFGAENYLIYMKGGDEFTHLNSIWRFSSALCYGWKGISYGVEYEITGATYGNIDDHGRIALDDELHQVVNHRCCAMVKYSF